MKITGINTNESPLNTNGSAQDIINLRNANGKEWETIYPPEEIEELPADISNWYLHQINSNGNKHYWGTKAIGGVLRPLFMYWEESGNMWMEKAFTDLINGDTFLNFIHFGNILVLNTSLNSYYYFYDNENYTLLGDLPMLRWNIDTTEREVLEGHEDDIDPAADWEAQGKVLIQKAINKATAEKKIQGHTFFRLAYITSTGEYILPTNPVYNYIGSILESECGNLGGIFLGKPNSMISHIKKFEYPTAGWRLWYSIAGTYCKPQININLTQQQLNIISDYQGLITGIAVFMSKPVLDMDYNNVSYMQYSSSPDKYAHVFYNNDGLNDCFKNTKAFYKVAEIDAKDLELANEIIVEVDALETNEILLPSIPHKPIGETVLDYNSRLHLANVTTKLTDANNVTIPDTIESYHFDDAIPSLGDIDVNDVFASVKLKINGTTKTVLTKYTSLAHFIANGGVDQYIMSPLITYPDARAYSLQLLIYDGEYKKLSPEYKLSKHPFLNLAYYLKEATEYPNNTTFDGMNVEAGIKFRIFQYERIDYAGSISIPTKDDRIYQDPNRIQVSANLDILSWPAKNSYRVGTLDNVIKSINSNAIPMSTAQYGMYPLMVFSKQGLYALEQGQDVLYKSIQPAGTDNILNNNTISTPFGIVFISERGVLVQIGQESVNISEGLKGAFHNYIKTNPNFVKLVDGSLPTGSLYTDGHLTGNIDTLDFKNAVLAYDTIRTELYLSFPNYTFIYNMVTKEWYKRSHNWTSFLVIDENLVGIKDSKFENINYQPGALQITAVDHIVITNPFQLGNSGLKKYFNIKLNFIGQSNAIENKNKLAVYLFASNNLNEWKLINGIQFKQSRVVELKNVRTSAKYHKLVIAADYQAIKLSDVEIDAVVSQD